MMPMKIMRMRMVRFTFMMMCDDIRLMLLIMMRMDACEVDDGAVATADAAIVDDDGINDYDNHDDVEKDDGSVSDDNDDILDYDALSFIFLSISYNNKVDVHNDER
jgi:hypothetical protein